MAHRSEKHPMRVIMRKTARRKPPKLEEMKSEPKHCDDYIDDPTAPEVLRRFLDRARAPAHGLLTDAPFPVLYADLEGVTHRVTMASRLGDVGITTDFNKSTGYDRRVWLESLSNFRDAL